MSFQRTSWSMLSFSEIICESQQLNRAAGAYYALGDVVNVNINSINTDARDLEFGFSIQWTFDKF